jgi:hypothetical protein
MHGVEGCMALFQAMTVDKGSRYRSTPLRTAAAAAHKLLVACVPSGRLFSSGAGAAIAATHLPVHYTRCGL